MSTATLTSKGQTTIPQDIRNYLHLKAGDRIEFIINDGKVLMFPATIDARDLKGMLPSPKKGVSLDEMEKTIRKTSARKCKV